MVELSGFVGFAGVVGLAGAVVVVSVLGVEVVGAAKTGPDKATKLIAVVIIDMVIVFNHLPIASLLYHT